MKHDTNGPRRMNQKIRTPHRLGPTNFEAIPTIGLLAELARCEPIAPPLAIGEALASVSNAKARPSASSEGDESNAQANRD